MKTIELIKGLRNETGAGIALCKRAVEIHGADFDGALTWLIEQGVEKNSQREEQAQPEIRVFIVENKTAIALISLSCETDFAVATKVFQKAGNQAAQRLLAGVELVEIEQLLQRECFALKEKVAVTQAFIHQKQPGLFPYLYQHHNGQLAALVVLDKKQPELGPELALQIAATEPKALNRQEIPESELSRLLDEYTQAFIEEGKPQALAQKIASKKLEKQLKAWCLLEQNSVRNPEVSVAQLVRDAGVEILDWVWLPK